MPELGQVLFFKVESMAELKNIRIAISGIYDYAQEELPSLQLPGPGRGAPDWVENKRIYKVYRPAAVLAAACNKFKMLPLTHHHPNTPVDGQNFRDLAVGYTGENPWIDYLDEKNEVGIRSTLMIYDEEALSAYNNGEIQLSPGYVAHFEWKRGTTPNGQDYDIIMREITDVNHLALLPAGRGGDDAVVMDRAAERVTVFDIVQGMKDDAPKGNTNASKEHVKKDKNGFSFIKNKNGSDEFGKITEAQAKAMGLKSAPIKLSEGSENTYGLKHIEYQHGEQIRNAGYESVSDFVEDVVSNFDEIHEGSVKDRNGEQVQGFYLAKSTSNGVIGIELELNEKGDFYTVNNGGIFRKKYLQNKKTLWSAPHAQTQQQDSALNYGAKTENNVLSDFARGECSKGLNDSIDDVFISDNEKHKSIFEIAKTGTVFDLVKK